MATASAALANIGGLHLTSSNKTMFGYASLEEAFPNVDPQRRPLGSMLILQVRQPKAKTRGGVILIDETVATQHYNTQIAKVIAIGPLAFRHRETGELWPEGAWVKVGDYVNIGKYQGDRFALPYMVEDVEYDPAGNPHKKTVKSEVVFVHYKDLALLSVHTGDPLAVTAFLD